MPNSIRDEDLRAAAFAKVQELRTRFGDRIPHSALMEGFSFQGRRVPLWSHMKGIYKPGVLGPRGAALSIQTSAESPYEDEHDPEAGHFIYKYRGTDANQADNRALRAAMVEQLPLIYFVAVDQGVFDVIAPVYIVGDDSEARHVTLVADQASAPLHFVDSPLATASRAYATRAVMHARSAGSNILISWTRRTSSRTSTRRVSHSSRTGLVCARSIIPRSTHVSSASIRMPACTFESMC